MNSEKKHYWNISFLHDSEQTAYGFRSFSTDAPVFRIADYKRFEEVVAPVNVGVILSISYLGEMTVEEWRGDA
jgi:hypothetical protein